jgi:hypothetical protein
MFIALSVFRSGSKIDGIFAAHEETLLDEFVDLLIAQVALRENVIAVGDVPFLEIADCRAGAVGVRFARHEFPLSGVGDLELGDFDRHARFLGDDGGHFLDMELLKAPVSHSRFTCCQSFIFDSEQSDSGKTVYFCIRFENAKGEPGPWGPMLSAVIPYP